MFSLHYTKKDHAAIGKTSGHLRLLQHHCIATLNLESPEFAIRLPHGSHLFMTVVDKPLRHIYRKLGTTPQTLSLDQRWINAKGRTKLLDFPAPVPPHARRFLEEEKVLSDPESTGIALLIPADKVHCNNLKQNVEIITRQGHFRATAPHSPWIVFLVKGRMA